MAVPRALIDGKAYNCVKWSVDPGQRLVATWDNGWQGGMGETKRRSPNRYLFGEGVDTATARYLRLHPEILATIEDANLDATLPVYAFEGIGPSATPTFDAATTDTKENVSSVSVNHTVAVQSERLLFVASHTRHSGGGQQATAMTFGGKSLTRQKKLGVGAEEMDLWFLTAPPTGTSELIVTYAASVESVVITIESWYNVHQSVPFGTAVSNNGSGITPTVNVTSAASEVVVDFGLAAYDNTDNPRTATVGASQTERANIIEDAGTLRTRAFSSSEPGAASVTMSWTIDPTALWITIGIPLKPPFGVPMVYVLNGRYGYKLNGSSFALLGTKDFGAGAQCGRPELFKSAHYIPLGSSVDAQKLTAFGAGDETTDTFAAIAGIKAHAFASIQDGSTAKLARALNNKVDISSDGADWSGADYEAGDDTFDITDLLPAPGELIVIRPDGPRRFNASGDSFEIQGFYPKDAGADATLGSNSHGHGPYSYWVDISSLWRIIGENAAPMGPEADPDFSPVSINGLDFPLTTGNWRSVTAIGRWLYATYYQSAGSINGDLLYGYIGSDGLIDRWHGSLFDSDRPLRVQRLSTPALVIVEGKPGDQDSPAIHIMALEDDGSPRTPLDGNRGRTPATGETYEHFAVMAPLDFSDLGFGDREKQIARVSFITEGMATGSDWRIRVWRDANARENLGSVVSTNGTNEVEPSTVGTNDSFYRLFVAPYCTVSDTFVAGDPRLRSLTVEARAAALITAEIVVTRENPAPNTDFESTLANLRALKGGPRVVTVAPERKNAINGHVVGVQEQQIGDPDTNTFGYKLTVFVETFDADAGSG